MSAEQRKSADNGIWLCQNCAKLVDNDSEHYPADLLREWKRAAEQATRDELEGCVPASALDMSAEVSLSYVKERIDPERHDYSLRVSVCNRGFEPIRQFHVDLEMPLRVIEDVVAQQGYVRQRKADGVAVFRFAPEKTGTIVYPGDELVVLSVPYFMDHVIYLNERSIMAMPVKATLYRQGCRPVSVTRPFSDLQIF